jgi:hypothetical protein
MSLIYPARHWEQSEFNLHYKFIYKVRTEIISITHFPIQLSLFPVHLYLFPCFLCNPPFSLLLNSRARARMTFKSEQREYLSAYILEEVKWTLDHRSTEKYVQGQKHSCTNVHCKPCIWNLLIRLVETCKSLIWFHLTNMFTYQGTCLWDLFFVEEIL